MSDYNQKGAQKEANPFRHQLYRSERPTSPYSLMPAGLPAIPSSTEFHHRIAAAGAAMGKAGVVAVYCVHGTFAGNDALGLMTELARVVPSLSRTLSKFGKQTVDLIAGEMGNFTPAYVAAMEAGLSKGAGRPIPVRRFNWSSQNNHIGRADGAVRLLEELAGLASQLPNSTGPNSTGLNSTGPNSTGLNSTGLNSTGPNSTGLNSTGPNSTGLNSTGPAITTVATHQPPRVVLWGHSHAGNLFALLTNLRAANSAARKQFYRAARCFYRQSWSGRIDMPAWLHGQQILREMEKNRPRADFPEDRAELLQAAAALRQVALDVVTFGTPIRYGWSMAGHANLLHFINHRPLPDCEDYLAPYPLDPLRMLQAADGDYVQQLGISGSNLYPNIIAWRTVVSDWRLGKLFESNLPRERLLQRVSRRMRVPDAGTTLLVDYPDHETSIHRRLLGHAVYTRLRWLPFHLEQLVKHCYGTGLA